jgi:hypothetical protein
LSAVDAAGDVNAFFKGAADNGAAATADKIKGGDSLYLFTDPDTFAAEYALVRITDNRETGGIKVIAPDIFRIWLLGDSVFTGQSIQFTIVSSAAIKAVIGMTGQ